MDGSTKQSRPDENEPLIISRRQNESIMIGDDITVVVVVVRDGTIRLGIEGPPGLQIRRGEDGEALSLGKNVIG